MTDKSKRVRLGVVGLGVMAQVHLKHAAEMEGVEIAALCDTTEGTRLKTGEQYGCPVFTNHTELLQGDTCDAVLIATPHYDHTPIGIDALKSGKHVLVEKPISVHKADCERLIAAHTDKRLVFAAMFNQRTDPFYRKLKQLIDAGELGALVRVSWIITNWFRTEAYYRGGGWRATWKGEGGGVLLNQCPHQLDLMQWLFGMPTKVAGFCGFGKRHDIEVEDQVTAYLEYENGATGTFITSTGEAPGTNRLEVAGERGRVVIEDDTFRFTRNETPADEFIRTSPEPFGKPGVWNVNIPISGHGGQHKEVLLNFIDAIRNGTELIAPAAEGIRSVELGNAILYSSLTGQPVVMPLDSSAYEAKLKQLISDSTHVKKTIGAGGGDLSKSFA
ncbi:MAG: Gfo/Idh/MocA family oxidoreductase [Phycisphaerales bacterium]